MGLNDRRGGGFTPPPITRGLPATPPDDEQDDDAAEQRELRENVESREIRGVYPWFRCDNAFEFYL